MSYWQLVENFNRQDMKLVDSIEAVQRFMKSLLGAQRRNGSTDEMISEVAKRLGVNRTWLSQNLKLEREAPKELKEEEAKHFSHMRAYYGYTAQKLADKYDIDKCRIVEYWRIASLPEPVHQWTDLSQQHLYSISKLVDKDQLVRVFEEG